jgi:hypothetical protein
VSSYQYEDAYHNRLHVDSGISEDKGQFVYLYVSDDDGVANIDLPKAEIQKLIDFLSKEIQ